MELNLEKSLFGIIVISVFHYSRARAKSLRNPRDRHSCSHFNKYTRSVIMPCSLTRALSFPHSLHARARATGYFLIHWEWELTPITRGGIHTRTDSFGFKSCTTLKAQAQATDPSALSMLAQATTATFFSSTLNYLHHFTFLCLRLRPLSWQFLLQ